MRYFVYPFRILRTVHWTYPLVRYLLKSICGTEQGRFLRSFLGYGSDAEEWNLLTLVHGSSPCGSGEVPIHPVRRSHAGHCGQPSFFLIYILCKGSVLTALESANGLISYRASRFLHLYRLRPAASDAVLSQSADPSPPMMNGIFEVCHGTWSLLPYESCRFLFPPFGEPCFFASGCFLSVTILYHSLRDSSIRRLYNLAREDLCIFRIDSCISKVV